MNAVAFVVALIAFVAFLAAAFGAATRVNLTAFGLACLTAAIVVQECAGGADVTF